MPDNSIQVNGLFKVKEKDLFRGKVTSWEKSLCTSGGIFEILTPSLILKKTWCPAIVRDGYRHTDKFVSAEYLVINFLSGDIDDSVFKKYRHIKYSAVVNGNHRLRFVLKYKRPVDLQTYKHTHSLFYKQFDPSVVDRSSSPVQAWSPGSRIIAVVEGDLI